MHDFKAPRIITVWHPGMVMLSDVANPDRVGVEITTSGLKSLYVSKVWPPAVLDCLGDAEAREIILDTESRSSAKELVDPIAEELKKVWLQILVAGRRG